jgi:hypothetical protein
MNSDFESNDDDDAALFQDVLNRTMDVLKKQKVLIDHDQSRRVMTDFIRHQAILRTVMACRDVPRILRDMLVVDLTQNTPRGDVQ